MNLSDLEGIGPVRLETLRAVGITSLRDLLFTLPVRYEDHSTLSPCTVKTPGLVLVSGYEELRLESVETQHLVPDSSVQVRHDRIRVPRLDFNEDPVLQIHHPGRVGALGRVQQEDVPVERPSNRVCYVVRVTS